MGTSRGGETNRRHPGQPILNQTIPSFAFRHEDDHDTAAQEFVRRARRAARRENAGRRDEQTDVPSVVPAECMTYFRPDFSMRRWTSAIWAETEGEEVPICERGQYR